MTDCSFSNPCDKNKACSIDFKTCRPIDPTLLVIYIKNHAFTGNISTLKTELSNYFSSMKNMICTSGNDIAGELHGNLSFAEFSNKDLEVLRHTIVNNNIIGLYNLENEKIICEVASTLIKFWDTKINTNKGVIITEYEYKFLKNKYDSYINNGENPTSARFNILKQLSKTNHRYFIPVSPFLTNMFITQEDMIKAKNSKEYFFLIAPTNLRWIDRNTVGMSVYHNFYPEQNVFGDKLYLLIPVHKNKTNNNSTMNSFKKSLEQSMFFMEKSQAAYRPTIKINFLSGDQVIFTKLDTNRIRAERKSLYSSDKKSEKTLSGLNKILEKQDEQKIKSIYVSLDFTRLFHKYGDERYHEIKFKILKDLYDYEKWSEGKNPTAILYEKN